MKKLIRNEEEWQDFLKNDQLCGGLKCLTNHQNRFPFVVVCRIMGEDLFRGIMVPDYVYLEDFDGD